LDGSPIPAAALAGCSVVIHAAARAHHMGETGSAALSAYRRTNVDGTRALIAAMEAAGVRRLVQVSSIKAIGERSGASPLRPGDLRRPEDPYGRSKAEAEDLVVEAHAAGRIEAVIIRPVLVHGPGAKGNLARLMQRIQRGRPVPVGRRENRRSLLGVANLADALLRVAVAPVPVRADGRPPIYHLADDGVVSTRHLVETLAQGLAVSPRMVRVPGWLLITGATLLGRGAMARRLVDDLEIDDGGFRRDYAWIPPLGLEQGLLLMARAWALQESEVPR